MIKEIKTAIKDVFAIITFLIINLLMRITGEDKKKEADE